jgi:hypothetical protein
MKTTKMLTDQITALKGMAEKRGINGSRSRAMPG